MDRDVIDFHRSPSHSAPVSAPAGNADTRAEVRTMRDHLLPRNQQRPAAAPSRQPVQTVNLQSILKGAREAIIDFDGAAYRLRITRNHRLILTK